MIRLRRGAGRHLGQKNSALGDTFLQVAVFFGIDRVDAAREHGDGAGLERSLMRRGVDAARQARNHRQAAAAQRGRDFAGEAPSIGRGVARSHYRLGVFPGLPAVAFHGEQRRRIVDLGQGRRVVGLAPGHQRGTRCRRRLQLALGLGLGGDADRTGTAAAPRDLGQACQRGGRRAETVQQLIERQRPRKSVAVDPNPPLDLIVAPPTCDGMKHKPALYALERLHAELGGKIKDNRKEAARLAESMRHVEAVIRLLEPSFDVRRITARRRYKSNPLFKRGQIFRAVVDKLRRASSPLTSREITVALLKDREIERPPVAMLRNLYGGVHASLRNHEGKTVETVGEGMPAKWRLKD